LESEKNIDERQDMGLTGIREGGESMFSSHGHGKGGHDAGCCGGFHRKFFNKEEKVVKMEAYAQELKDELKAVEMIIQKIKEGKESW